jgi:hypothetical protein
VTPVHLARQPRACAPRAVPPDVAPRRPIPSKEFVMDRKELAFFVVLGGLVLVAIAVVVTRFV